MSIAKKYQDIGARGRSVRLHAWGSTAGGNWLIRSIANGMTHDRFRRIVVGLLALSLASLTLWAQMTITPAGGSTTWLTGTSLLYTLDRVGIGVASPNAKLEISGNYTGGSSIGSLLRVSGMTNPNIAFFTNSANANARNWMLAANQSNFGSLDFLVSTSNSNDPGTQVLTILKDGSTGFNTTAPDRALEINSATGNNVRLTYNDSNGTAANYADFLVSSAGILTIAAVGQVNITDADGTPDFNLSVTGAPTPSTCGDGAVSTGSSNSAGRVVGTTQTACTLTFSTTLNGNDTACLVNNETAAGRGYVSAHSSTAFTVSGLTAGDDFSWHCFGY